MDFSGDNAWGLLYYHDVANPAWGSIPGYSLRTVHWRNALVDGDRGDECPCATTVYRCLYFVISMESILRSRIFQQQGVRFSKLLRIALAYEDRIWTHAGSSEEYGRIMSSLETFTRDTWNTFNLKEEEEEQQRQQLHILQHCDTNLHLLYEACDLSKSGNFPSFHELLAWWPLLPQPYRKLLEPWWTLQQFPASSSAAASCYSSFLPLSRPRPSQPGAAAAAGASSRPALELIDISGLIPSSSSSSSSSMAFKQQGQQFGQRTLEGSLMDCDILACEIYMSLRHLVENGGGGGDDGVHPALPGPSLSLLRWGMITEGRVIDTMQYLLHQQQTN
ncbi:unnamed protein product [Sphagnum tenellum]